MPKYTISKDELGKTKIDFQDGKRIWITPFARDRLTKLSSLDTLLRSVKVVMDMLDTRCLMVRVYNRHLVFDHISQSSLKS